MTRSLHTKLPAVIAVLFVVWALRGGRPEVVPAPFHSYVPIVLDDLLGPYLSAEQQSEEAIKVMQRGLGSRQLGLSGHDCVVALGMCHGTVQALGPPWMDFRPRVRTRFRDPRLERTRFGDSRVTAGELAAQAKHSLQLPVGLPVTPGYGVLDRYPSWLPEGAVYSKLRVDFGGDNLTDKAHRRHPMTPGGVLRSRSLSGSDTLVLTRGGGDP